MRKLYSLLMVLFVLSGCNTVKVTHDYDQSKDYTKYKTFTITDPLASLPISDEGRELFYDAIYVEMTKKGLKPADNGDLLIDVIGIIQNKTGTSYRTDNYNSYYPYYYYGSGAFTTTRVETVDIKEGTIILNISDKSNDRVIWQGRAVTKVSPGEGNQENKIRKAISQILTWYPPKPVKSQPKEEGEE